MKYTSRAVAALTVATAVVVTSPVGSPAEAKLAPTLSIVAGDPSVPVEVPPPTADDPSGAILNYEVDVAGGPATNVTVTVSGVGLNVSYYLHVSPTPGPVNLGTVADKEFNYVTVTAATGGFHQLTFTVTADGAAPATTTLNYVWSPTGALTVSPAAGLRSTYFYTTGEYSENDTTYGDPSMLLFLNDAVAYYGTPDAGLPKCKTGSTSATSGCLAYAYDPTNHLIQVGGAIGTVDAKGVHTIGLGITDVQGGDSYAKRDWVDRLAFPRHPQTYARTWRWTSGHHCARCFTYAALTLRKNHTFVLSDDWRKKRTISGHYALSRSGRLTLTGRFGREVHTFALQVDQQDKPDSDVGIALTYGKGKSADYYFLTPRK